MHCPVIHRNSMIKSKRANNYLGRIARSARLLADPLPYFPRLAIVSALIYASSIPVVGPANAGENADPCPASEIAFTPIEPKYPTWWTFWAGRVPASKLLRHGQPAAEIELRYNDIPFGTGVRHEGQKTFRFGKHVFDYDHYTDDESLSFEFHRYIQSEAMRFTSPLQASGIIVYRVDGSTLATVYMQAKADPSVAISFEYGKLLVPKERVFGDIYCFIMSATAREGLQ